MLMVPGWHPLVVHFPLALIVTAAVALSVARLLPSQRLAATVATVGTWNLCLGAATVLFALATGLAAVIHLQVGPAAHQAISIHLKSAVLTTLLVLSVGVWRGVGTAQDSRPSWIFIIVLWAATAALVVTGYRGAQNVYRYGVGVSSTVESDESGARLRAVFAASDEATLKRNPLQALFRGDMRYADQFGDFITDAYFAAEKKAAVDDLAALAGIDRRVLGAADGLSYDAFKFQRSDDLQGFEPALLNAQIERPIEHFFGMQTVVPDLASGQGAAPFNTAMDYDNNLKRLDGYVVYLDRAIGRMKQGLADGVTNPKPVMANVIGQLDSLVAEGVEGSTFYKPVKNFPDGVSAADRTRLTAAYAAFIRDRLNPAHVRLRDFIKSDYLPRARDSVGLGQMPGGEALYRHLVASTTTTDMTPAAIHALGLTEVGRIHSELEKVRATVGFKGNAHEFANFMRTDPKFAPASREAMRDAFVAIDKKVRAEVPKDFASVPKSPLEIRPVPGYKEKTEAAGSYQQGTPDGSRPGIFYYDAYDLPSRFTWGFETLFLHEGIPGHHFQVSLAQENTSLPAFQRFGGNTAYVEGWALYSESLGTELGLYTDPYQLYGHLNDEMLRAMRLVVDTGIHAQGWSREAAIAYMLENSAMGRTDVTAEVERYIAIPGQALAYKVGQLTIRRLRTEAETKLGPTFDARAFHAQVLDSGALPLKVLEAKINAWVAASTH